MPYKPVFKNEIPIEPQSDISIGVLFCGAGSPILASEWSGLKVLWGIEPRKYFNIQTFRTNFPDTLYSVELEAFFQMKPDVIWGSPSCGEFSSAGRNSKNAVKMQNKKFTDFEYVKFILEIKKRRPAIFILENIPSVKSFVQFESTAAGFVLRHQISREEVSLYDYYIEEHRISPVQIGFPQKRERIFTIGSLYPKTFMLQPPTADKKTKLPIRNIFESLDELRKERLLFNDTIPVHSPEKIEKMSRVKPGELLYGGINNKRLKVEEPSPVIMGSSTNYIHPWENRLLTPRESASLMGYPLDFRFFGSENACRDQIGKGIVPHVGAFILKQIKEYLEGTK